MKNKKKFIVITVLMVLVLFTSYIFYHLTTAKKISVRINNKYYSMELPKNWTSKSSSDILVHLIKDSHEVASIEVNYNACYTLTTSSLVVNFVGMHAYIKKNYKEKEVGSYKIHKVLVAYEAYATDFETPPDELHYFFTEGKNFLDLKIKLKYINEKTADKLANSIKTEKFRVAD